MKSENFSIEVQNILKNAHNKAVGNGHKSVETGHFLWSALQSEKTYVIEILGNDDSKYDALLYKTEQLAAKYPAITSGKIQLGASVQRFFEFGTEFLAKNKLQQLDAGNFFNLLSTTKDEVANLLIEFGINGLQPALLDKPFEAPVEEIPETVATTPEKAPISNTTDILAKISSNLTARLQLGSSESFIGREQELNEVFRKLYNEKHKIVLLTGNKGCGKTAMANGLAAILKNKADNMFHDYQVHYLNLAGMLQAENMDVTADIDNLLHNVNTWAPKTILFFDNFHLAFNSAEPINKLWQLVKTANIYTVGTANSDALTSVQALSSVYAQNIAIVPVQPAPEPETVEIIQSIKETFELFNRLILTESATKAAVKLASFYTEKVQLPASALDLLDLVASDKKMKFKAIPLAVKEAKLKAASREGKDVEYALGMNRMWEEQKQMHQIFFNALGTKIKMEIKLKSLEQAGVSPQLSDLKHNKLPEAVRNYKLYKSKLIESTQQTALIDYEISAIDIFEKVSELTKIPVLRLKKFVFPNYEQIEEELNKTVLQRQLAINPLMRLLERKSDKILSGELPAKVLFVGLPGTGKTLLVKQLAEIKYGSANFVKTVYLADFSTAEQAVEKLSQTVTQLRKGIICFEQTDAANAEIFNVVLHFIDNMQLTDEFGLRINYSEILFVFMSNAGAEYTFTNLELMNGAGKDKFYAEIRNAAIADLETKIGKEAVYAIDELCFFYPLTYKTIQQIIGAELDKIT
ncbi:MAG TPA: hypothetical protein DCQ31_17120, partial [Bacteroidales bacterium]|nr:hypothetical protein [Bacteroidales bacterium]